MDKLIKYVNARTHETGIEILYSTPSCYLKGLYDDLILNYPDFKWTEKTDDFFPYASGLNSYWTGYFTSRPTLKYMERVHNNLLQAAKQIQALYVNNQSKLKASYFMKVSHAKLQLLSKTMLVGRENLE